MDTLDDTSVLIPDVFEVHARTHPDKEAVVCGPVRQQFAGCHIADSIDVGYIGLKMIDRKSTRLNSSH